MPKQGMEQALVSRKKVFTAVEAIAAIPVHFWETSTNCTS